MTRMQKLIQRAIRAADKQAAIEHRAHPKWLKTQDPKFLRLQRFVDAAFGPNRIAVSPVASSTPPQQR